MNSHIPTIEHDDWSYEVRGDFLVASHAGVEQMRLALAPLVEREGTTIVEWSQRGIDQFVGKLDRGGSVHIEIDCGHLCYWMETDIEHFETLAYFPGTTFAGKYWQTYVSDEHDRKWDTDIDQEVGISSAYDDLFNPFGADGQGMTDPGDFPPYFIWNVPVRAFSFQTGEGWIGFSVPGALPVGVVRLRMEKNEFSLHFDVLRPCCGEGMMPRVYLAPGMPGAYDVLERHRIISDRLGLTVVKQPNHPSWWSNPAHNYYDEYLRLVREDKEGMTNGTILSSERYIDWLNTIKTITGVGEINYNMEQGCYHYYGDYRPLDSMGGVEGFRTTVDQLRKEGTRFAYYIHPYIVNSKVGFWKAHPEAFCKPRDASHKFKYGLEYGDADPELHLLDWTHPGAREFMEETVKFLISDEPGCLNCDIIRSNHWRSPDPRIYDFHDPDWGIGDLMTYKVQRFIYETAKRVKPDCMVSKVGLADPFMQPWADVDYLCEEWNGYTDNWYRRGRIVTRAMRDMIFLTDPFFVTLTKGYEYYMGMLAWNYPETCALRHAIHPYQHYREMKDKDFKRRSAGIHAYLNAPFRVGDVCRVGITDVGEVEQWRKRAVGKLAGFYAGLAIGKRTLVTYSETEARIATSISRRIEVPLPPGAKVISVGIIPHEGEPEEWPCEPVVTDDGPGLRMHVEDCGKRALCYRIAYVLPE